MGKGIVVLLLLAFAMPALAQTAAGQGRGQPRVGPAPKAHYNSTAKDTTPFNCEQASQPGTTIGYRPGMRGEVFPRSEGYDAGNTFTGPTLGL